MRMVLSISGHSSELSIHVAKHSSRPTVSQLKCVSDIISNWFEKEPTAVDKNLSVIYAPFRFKTQINGPLGWLRPQVFWGYFFNSCNFKATSKLCGSQGCSDDKAWLDFSSIFFKIFKFRSSILLLLQVFIPQEATLESGLTGFSSTNHSSLLRTVNNEIASFCIDNRSRQMAFIVFAKVGKGRAKAGFLIMLKYFEIKRLCYYLKQTDSMLLCVCSVIDHRWHQNVIRTKKWHTRHSRVCHWCSYHILMSSVIYYWTDAWQHRIYLLNRFYGEGKNTGHGSLCYQYWNNLKVHMTRKISHLKIHSFKRLFKVE